MGKTHDNSIDWSKAARILAWVGFSISLSIVFLVVLAVVLYGMYRTDIPNVVSLKDYRPNLRSKVYAQNGELIAEFGIYERIVVKKGDFPPLIAQAFISSEDKNFYKHHGIDFAGVINALLQTLSGKRSSLRGASTISQQLAKSLLVKKEGYDQATARTLSRKVKEAILARRLEMHLKKEDILWMYLNEVYLGHGSYGVGAAARNYFRKSLKDLTLGEIAILAGLPQAPSRFSPQANMTAAFSRQSYVLGRLRDDRIISQNEHDEAVALNKQIKIFDRENIFRKKAPYFTEMIRQSLIAEFGEERVYEDGLNVYTTVDLDQQRSMQDVLQSGLIEIDKRQGFLGPIYRPKNGYEQKMSKNLVKRINNEKLLQMGDDYRLAIVDKVDNELAAVFIDTGDTKGVVPLAGMFWARARDPQKNYEVFKLDRVFGVLNPSDVVLVKFRTWKEIEARNSRLLNQSHLFALRDRHYDDFLQQKLLLFSLEQEPSVEGAMFAIEPSSGYVVAMAGGYSFDRSEFNRVYQACRQPGSLFKPVVYTAAITQKKYTPATLVLDAPITFHDGDSESSWKPKNLGNKFQGEVTVREAVMRSMNIPTLNVTADVGVKNVLEFANRLGIKTKLKAELGVGIGSSCVTLWEMGGVFTTLANMGIEVQKVMVKEITDRDHKRIRFQGKKIDPWIVRNDRTLAFLDEFYQEKKRVLEPEDAYSMHYLLTEAANHGTAQKTSVLNRHLAGKTGTTNDSFDVWFAGYSKNLMTLIWVGNDTMDKPLGVYEQGARTTVPLFTDFMGRALFGLPDEGWQMPSTMCEARIDSKTGLRIETDRPLSFVAPFRCGQEPALAGSVPRQSLEQAMEVMSGM